MIGNLSTMNKLKRAKSASNPKGACRVPADDQAVANLAAALREEWGLSDRKGR
jgi:hypothetical protein